MNVITATEVFEEGSERSAVDLGVAGVRKFRSRTQQRATQAGAASHGMAQCVHTATYWMYCGEPMSAGADQVPAGRRDNH